MSVTFCAPPNSSFVMTWITFVRILAGVMIAKRPPKKKGKASRGLRGWNDKSFFSLYEVFGFRNGNSEGFAAKIPDDFLYRFDFLLKPAIPCA